MVDTVVNSAVLLVFAPPGRWDWQVSSHRPPFSGGVKKLQAALKQNSAVIVYKKNQMSTDRESGRGIKNKRKKEKKTRFSCRHFTTLSMLIYFIYFNFDFSLLFSWASFSFLLGGFLCLFF
jgi:hypothetical protein